jgi:hypothetical protein
MVRNARDQWLIAGIVKHLGKSGKVVLRGVTYTTAELTAKLQSRIEASNEADIAKAAWRAKVRVERARVEETSELVTDLRVYLATVYGSSLEVLHDFGFAPKDRRILRAAEKAQAALKGQATREARHTMGKRQKEKVKGDGAPPLPAPSPPPPPTGLNGSAPAPPS